MASGDVVNTAARLQAAAPVNGILVDETTYRATRARDPVREPSRSQAKGKAEPVPSGRRIEARSRFGVESRAQTAAGPARRPRARARRPRGSLARSRASARPSSSRSSAFPGSARAASSSSCSIASTPTRTSSTGARADRCPTARASPSGPWARWSRPRRGSSRPIRRSEAESKLQRSVAAICSESARRGLGRAAPPAARRAWTDA